MAQSSLKKVHHVDDYKSVRGCCKTVREGAGLCIPRQPVLETCKPRAWRQGNAKGQLEDRESRRAVARAVEESEGCGGPETKM